MRINILPVVILYLLPTILCEQNENVTVINIEPWQYCAGCKCSIEALHGVAGLKFKEMENEKQGSSYSATLNLRNITATLCRKAYFDDYQPFIRHSCNKIIKDEYLKFLRTYKKAQMKAYENSYTNLYAKSLQICGKDLKACNLDVFVRSNHTEKDRTKCNACKIIAEDIEMTMKVRYASASKILEDICAILGLHSQPYAWMEQFCDDLVEDHSDRMVEIMAAHNTSVTKKVPNLKPLSEKLCGELLKCDASKFASAPVFSFVKEKDQTKPKSEL